MKHLKDPVDLLSQGDYFGFCKAMVELPVQCYLCGSSHLYKTGLCKECYKEATDGK